MMIQRLLLSATTAAAAALIAFTYATPAHACGCFAPPDPSVPIVQAGERIVFSHDAGKVTAHIQIQYQGSASEFGWILPLPAVPEFALGVEELFARIVNATQPKYRLTRQFGDQCNAVLASGGARGNSESSDGFSGTPQDPAPGVLVVEDSVGPYDYAVLRADSKDEMLEWLNENRYFIPGGTEEVMDPYVRPGAYFLALKLRKGSDAGDLQPVVLTYESDLPMIPIILTQVAANPNMGIQVWTLGESRGIPRNYRHTVLNTEHLDWANAGANYNDLVISAVDEAEGHHSFITEFAGSSDVMKDQLDYEGRFGNRQALEGSTDPVEFVQALRNNGFLFSGPTMQTLRATWNVPEEILANGETEDGFYNSLDYWAGWYKEQFPEKYDEAFDFDPVQVTADLWDRVVVPTLAAGRLFRDNPVLTRMYTTLSPSEMTKDPVFSFNADLPMKSNIHQADLTQLCNTEGTPASNILKLPDGRQFYVDSIEEFALRDRSKVPFSTRIELLREEGAPEIELDNDLNGTITPSDISDDGCSCTATSGAQNATSGVLFLAGLALLVARRRRSH